MDDLKNFSEETSEVKEEIREEQKDINEEIRADVQQAAPNNSSAQYSGNNFDPNAANMFNAGQAQNGAQGMYFGGMQQNNMHSSFMGNQNGMNGMGGQYGGMNGMGGYQNGGFYNGYSNMNGAYNANMYSNGYSEEYEKAMREAKKKKTAFRKTVALGLAGAVVLGVSLGASLGVAYNSSRNLFAKTSAPFSFSSSSASNNTADPVAMEITPANDDIIETINKVQDSIVNISIVVEQQGWYSTYESEGAGSGIIYSEDDEKVYIVTNNHVVEDATKVSISITGDEQIKATLVGKDASSDLAVIYVLKSDLKEAGIDKVNVAVFGDSDSVQVGEYVIAIGNALGEGKTTTRGIISAQNKTINIDGKEMQMIQTDAAINPGNSGGALVNSAGQVIGINTAKYASAAVEGTGFAIPVNSAKDVIAQLVENGTVDKPFLGIAGYTIDDDFKQMYNIDIDGVFITDIEDNSAAEKAGLNRTDIITAIDGTPVKDIKTLSSLIAGHKSGDKVTLDIIRNGSEKMTVTATLKNLNEQF